MTLMVTVAVADCGCMLASWATTYTCKRKQNIVGSPDVAVPQCFLMLKAFTCSML